MISESKPDNKSGENTLKLPPLMAVPNTPIRHNQNTETQTIHRLPSELESEIKFELLTNEVIAREIEAIANTLCTTSQHIKTALAEMWQERSDADILESVGGAE